MQNSAINLKSKLLRNLFCVAICFLVSGNLGFAQTKKIPTRLLFILDASGSMAGKWQEGNRMDAAKAIITHMADSLAKENISVEIIDLRTVRPLDHDTIIESVKKTNRLVILEEAWPFGSVSTEITYRIQDEAFDYLDAPIKRITTADTPAPYSPVLLEAWIPNSKDVIKAVKEVLKK